MTTKKKVILTFIGMAVCIATLLLVFFSGEKLRGGKDTEANTDPPTSDMQPVSDEVEKDDDNSAASQEMKNQEFIELYPASDDNMVGRVTYMGSNPSTETLDGMMETLKLVPENTDLGPVILSTGHQVYRSQIDGAEYIISGHSRTIKVQNGLIMDISFLREEGSDKRVYTVPNQSMLETFNQQWEDGQNILSGKEKGEHGCIILDGALTPYQFTEENGKIQFKLLEIAQMLNPATIYEETEGYIRVLLSEENSVRIFTTAVDYAYQKNHNIDFIKDTFRFRSWAGPKFEYRAPLLDYETLIISAEDASRMLGWHMYFNGDVLSIETDPSNIRDAAVVYSNGSLGIFSRIETDADGNAVLNTYDENGTLIGSKIIETDTASEEESAVDELPVNSGEQE